MDISDGHPVLRSNRLVRPRVNKLVSQSLDYPLTVVVAAPGYGKTLAVAAFIDQQKAPYAWTGLSVLDNDPHAFWEKFTSSFSQVSPALTEIMHEIEFPETIEQFSKFIETARDVIADLDQAIIIIDDYDIITNEKINRFINWFLNVNFTEDLRWHWVIISNTPLSTKQSPFHESLFKIGEYFKISASELEFTLDEARRLFLACGKQHSDYQLKKLLEKTGGWPVYLDLMCQGKTNGDIARIVSELFETQFYANFSPDFQTLLLKLSLLPRFSLPILKSVQSGDLLVFLQEISSNILINLDEQNHLYKFQPLYQEFLSSKAILLSEEEKDYVRNNAADWFFHQGLFDDAELLYVITKNYQGLMECLSVISKKHLSTSRTNMIRDVLERIPEDYRRRDPRIDFNLAFSYINNGQVFLSRNSFVRLLEEFPPEQNKQYLPILGDSYRSLADISTVQNTLGGLEYVKKAVEYLPYGSIVVSQSTLGVGENAVFYLPEKYEGTVFDMIDYIKEMSSYRDRISNGCYFGFEYLFEAEALFALGNLKRAEISSEQAIQKADSMSQYDIVFNGYLLLLRLALCSGKFQNAKLIIDRLDTYYNQIDAKQLSDFKDMILALLYIKTGNLKAVASWIKTANFETYEEKPLWVGRNIVICSYYALYNEEYARALSLLTLLDAAFVEKGLWQARVVSHTIKAVAFHALEDTESAIAELWHAYEMLQPYDLFYPFVEIGMHLPSLIAAARKDSRYAFDAEWLNKAESLAFKYSISLEKTSKELLRDTSISRFSMTLTEREQQVIQLLSQGLTREEIAYDLGISINGVKKQLDTIYKKLGAHNRSEAVYIASVNGIA